MSEPDLKPRQYGDFRGYNRPLNFAFIWNLAHAPRKRMYESFLRDIRPQESESVFDLGVTQVPEPLENMFELYYPHKSRITAAGVEDCSFLEKSYPGLKFVKIEGGKPLPFKNDAFDVGFSNAVIEHAGSRDRQALFLSELIRVSRRCFLTTPNRWFPFELHTRLPFLHWLPPRIYRRILKALGLDHYALEENLNLLSAPELLALVPPGDYKTVALKRNYFFGFASNLLLVVEKKELS